MKEEVVLNTKEQLFPNDNIPFSKFYKNKLEEYNEENNLHLTKEDIAIQLDIPKTLMPKYIANGDKATKKRDCIIAMCMIIHMDVENTNVALIKYDMPPLNDSNKRDKTIISLINKNREINDSPLSFKELNEYLFNHTGTTFDIIDHRNIKKQQIQYPYRIKKTKVKCWTDDILLGDIYDSLDTVYSRLCKITAFMWLDDDGEREYKLCAESSGYLSCTEYPTVGEWYHEYDTIDDTGIFKICFKELQKMIRIEQRKMADMLNDTRSYHERISAKVIKNELHVFYETYNYKIPELGEYYLMDYENGNYTLYVSYDSSFMRYYLSENEYRELFGRASDKIEESYSSVEAIEHAIKASQPDRKDIIKLRIKAFCDAKEKVDTLIDDLKAEKAYIRNLEMIYDIPYDVLSYYKVTDEFKCTFDQEYGEIDSIGVDKVMFTLSDDRQVELTFNDLCAGFKLGLSSIDEVGTFLLEHQTFEIAELI